MKYDKSNWTWGYELEFGDINRSVIIPNHLGKWEYAETDIVNLKEPYRGLACDPLGLEPPVGGEINTMPTSSWEQQVERIFEIINLFRDLNQQPTTSCVNHGHLHVHVPGLKNDIHALKKLTRYIRDNQHMVIDRCYQFRIHPDMSMAKTAKTYLKWDGGRPMPDYMASNILNLANNFEDFIRLHAAGKDGVSMGRPFRHAINTYCMKHTDTIEFRCFRSSIDRKEIEDSFRFVEMFIDAALNDGPEVEDIFFDNNFIFPKFEYDHEMYVAWENTKYNKTRGTKVREFNEVR